MANKKISELPYINSGEISGNTLVPLVTYFSATTGDTVHTYITDLQNYLTSGITGNTVVGDFLPLSGGTVSGGTIFSTNGGTKLSIDTDVRALYDGGNVVSVDWEYRGLTNSLGNKTVDYESNLLLDVTGINSIEWDGRNLVDDQSTGAISWTSSKRTLSDFSGATSTDYGYRRLFDSSGISKIDWENSQINDSGGTQSIFWGARRLYDKLGQTSIDYDNRSLIKSSSDIVFNWENGILTGQTNIESSTISATTYLNLPPATFSGGTVTGPTIFTNGLTANTISATTYQNLPDNVTGKYLPLSGGTVSGATRFLSGLTANTISADTLTVTDNISSTNRTLYRTPSGGFLESVDYGNSKLWGVYSPSIDWELRQIFDEQGTMAINYSGVTRYLMDDTGQQSVDWQARKLYTFIGDEVFDWENGILTGQTNIQSSTISATTYLNLPASLTGQYLPLSGGTVSGTTYFTQGVSGSTVSATTFNFDTTFTGSTLVGQMTWNQDFGVPQVGMVGGNVVQKIGENVFAYVKNVETSTLTKGEVVYIFGVSGDKISVKRASNTGDTTSSKTLGVVAESITAGSLGYVITQGTLDGLNLGSYVAGDVVWLSDVPGQFTKVKQYAPYHLVFIGVVQRANAGNGQLYVLPQNGYELDELHNVAITGATFGDILTYSASGSNNLWVSTKTLNGSYTITGNTTIGGNLTATTISATTYQNLPTDIRVTGSTYSNNTFTYTNNTGGTFNVLFNTVTGLTVNGNLTVTGNTNVRSFTGTTGYISGSGQNILTVIGSGNSTTSPIFTVQGSSGELFSVTDSLVGSLFSVNDISGLPILEVFSDNTTLWGSYQAPSLNTTTRTSLTAGTNTIYSIPTSAYTGAFYEYTLISTGTTGARAGQIMSIWSGTTANFTETTTTDIGTTTGVTFTVAVSGNNAVLSSSATTAGWTVKTIIRSI